MLGEHQNKLILTNIRVNLGSIHLSHFSLSLLGYRTSANGPDMLWLRFAYTDIQVSWPQWTSCWPSRQTQWGFRQMKCTKSQRHAKVKADGMSDVLTIQMNSPDINNIDPRKANHLWNMRTLSSAGDTRPNSDCSSNSGSHDESDQ